MCGTAWTYNKYTGKSLLRPQSKIHEANKNIAFLYNKAELRKLNILRNKIFDLKSSHPFSILLRFN